MKHFLVNMEHHSKAHLNDLYSSSDYCEQWGFKKSLVEFGEWLEETYPVIGKSWQKKSAGFLARLKT